MTKSISAYFIINIGSDTNMSEDNIEIEASRRTSTATAHIADRSSAGSFDNEAKADVFGSITSSQRSTRPNVPRGYSTSITVVEDGTTKTHLKRIWQQLTVGGSEFDGFLLAASQEVGQSILALPMVFAQLGFAAGIVFELFFATLALYTCVLLVQMHGKPTKHSRNMSSFVFH